MGRFGTRRGGRRQAGSSSPLIRTAEEWAAHPQGKYLADKPLVEIIKIGDSDPEPFTPAARPLSGLRVLAATHVIAGNVMARTLAEHGAEVLQIAHPEEFEHEGFARDPCAGFTSSAWLDLKQPEGPPKAYELAAGADVFVENYRGRKIADLGMSPEELAARRPGIIYASDKAFSHDGPWANRAGFDMEALCVTGFATEEGTPEQPKFPPTHVMNDFIAGYIGAAGIQAALIRRAKEGGSYHVRVNLARCAMWFMSLGHLRQGCPGARPASSTNSWRQTPSPLRPPTANWSDWPHRRNSPKPSRTGETRYWWCAGQASLHGQPAEAFGDPRARWRTAGLAQPTRPRGNEENDDYESLPGEGIRRGLRADAHFTALVTAQGANAINRNKRPC